MATQINFVIDAGTKFDAIAQIKNEDGTPYDLTNLSITSKMKKSYYTTNGIDITCGVDGDPTLGNISMEVNPPLTELAKNGKWVYDVEVSNPVDINYIKRVLEGVITVNPQVTWS